MKIKVTTYLLVWLLCGAAVADDCIKTEVSRTYTVEGIPGEPYWISTSRECGDCIQENGILKRNCIEEFSEVRGEFHYDEVEYTYIPSSEDVCNCPPDETVLENIVLLEFPTGNERIVIEEIPCGTDPSDPPIWV